MGRHVVRGTMHVWLRFRGAKQDLASGTRLGSTVPAGLLFNVDEAAVSGLIVMDPWSGRSAVSDL